VYDKQGNKLNLNQIVKEILNHECEKHDLLYFGLIDDFDALTKQVAGKIEIYPDLNKTKAGKLKSIPISTKPRNRFCQFYTKSSISALFPVNVKTVPYIVWMHRCGNI